MSQQELNQQATAAQSDHIPACLEGRRWLAFSSPISCSVWQVVPFILISHERHLQKHVPIFTEQIQRSGALKSPTHWNISAM